MRRRFPFFASIVCELAPIAVKLTAFDGKPLLGTAREACCTGA